MTNLAWESPYIVVLGGTLRAGSATEKVLRLAAGAAERRGAETRVLAGPDLELPLYNPGASVRSSNAEKIIRELRKADGIILGSPVYHGTVSGVIKNVLDYVQDMMEDDVPYLQDRAVGLIAMGAGWQGAVNTLQGMRTIVHSLRGWPTPYGLPVNSIETGFDNNGELLTEELQGKVDVLAGEVVDFARKNQYYGAFASHGDRREQINQQIG